MKTRVVVLAVVGVLGVAAIAVAGTLGYQMFFGSSEDDAVALVPADAVVYGNIFLDPSMDQKRAIGDLLEKFPEAPNADEARNKLVDLFDEGLAEIDMNFDDDIDPWLGNQVAGWAQIPDDLMGGGIATEVPTPPAAFLIASDDDDAALQFVEEASANSDDQLTDESYEGADYMLNEQEGSAAGVVDGFLVIGSEEGFKAVVDVSGGEDNLSDSGTFTETTDELTEDRLATFYFDGAALAEALEASGAPAGAMEFGSFGIFGGSLSPTAGALFVESDKVVFESTTMPGDEDGEEVPEISNGLLPDLPGDSWGAFGLPDLGTTLEDLYDTLIEAFAQGGMSPDQLDSQFEAQTGLNLREDLLSWMGDAGLFVAGTDPLSTSGGLVIESTDPATSSATVDQLAALLQQQGIPTEPFSAGGADGFAVEIPAPGVTERAVVLAGDRVVIAYGEEAAVNALESSDPLSESEAFQTATEGLGDDFTAAGYFDVDAMQELAEAAGASQFPEYEAEVKPWLDPFTYVTFGSREDGGRLLQRLVIGID
ncbi:MAG: DUF3352 domain-containing protein [Actinomycetota bacterium]